LATLALRRQGLFFDQVWFVTGHVVNLPVVKVDPKGNVDI